MANYINSEVLAEAYTHLEIDIFKDKQKLEQLRLDLKSFFQERASFFFGADVEIKIEFEEGSLKTKIIAVGSAAVALTTAIGAYGNFRDNVIQLANDATSIAQSANLEVVFRTKTPYCDRIRIEKRKGVFGRVASLINELESVSAAVSNSQLPTSPIRLKNANMAVEALLSWERKADVLFKKFEDPETSACIGEGLLSELKKLPRQFPWQNILGQEEIANQIINADSEFSGAVSATSVKYTATLKNVEKKIKDRMQLASIRKNN